LYKNNRVIYFLYEGYRKDIKKAAALSALTGVSPEKIYESLPYFEIEIRKA
jgi:hypothetical protein